MRSVIFLSALLLSGPLAKLADYHYSDDELKVSVFVFIIALFWDLMESGKSYLVKIKK
jgi:hypothetical protein